MPSSSQQCDPELDSSGVCVMRSACAKHLAEACLTEVQANLEQYLSLPAPMSARTQKRHFLRFLVEPLPTQNGLCEEFRHRTDFVLPISKAIHALLTAVLACPSKNWEPQHQRISAGATLLTTLGHDAKLTELTAIISDPGCEAQELHSDANWDADAPMVVTIFIPLHDILSEDQGPTRFVPKTHRPCCFADGRWQPPPRGAATASVWFGPLHAGDAVLMHATIWHCGGANASAAGATRTMLAASFTAHTSSAQPSQHALSLRDFL